MKIFTAKAHILRKIVKKRKAAIVSRYIPQYRERFYELLKVKLEQMGIELNLIYGQASNSEAAKKDAIDIAWGQKVQNTYFKVRKWDLCWQPVLPFLRGSDIVIVDIGSRFLINYILVLLNTLGIINLAFWGHGKNFQAKKEDYLSERIKQILGANVNWWFTHNDLSASFIRAFGFPGERITIVQNAIDTRQLIIASEELKPEDLEKIRRQVGLTGKHIGLFVGGMYPERQLEFLLDSLIIIREQIPDFEMIFIGSGIDAGLIEDASRKYLWIHYLGQKFNAEKVPYFALSQLFLMPGVIGLAILDCIVMGLPLVTTRNPLHGPEIEYLDAGENGIVVDSDGDPQIYGQAVIDLFINERKRLKLVQGCWASRSKFSIENMVINFANGIQNALEK